MTTEGENQNQGEQVDYKAEFEKQKAENENLKQKNSELSSEFMGEEYLEFLNVKSGKQVEKPAEKKVETSDDEFEKLSKKQIYDRALNDAKAAAKAEVDADRNARAAEASEKTKSEVQKFAASHQDFEDYRPIMHGLSFDKKYEGATLTELYEASKAYVKNKATGASDAEKERSKKSSNEKPGHSSSSFQKAGKKLTADEAAEEAWDEVVGKDKTLSA